MVDKKVVSGILSVIIGLLISIAIVYMYNETSPIPLHIAFIVVLASTVVLSGLLYNLLLKK